MRCLVFPRHRRSLAGGLQVHKHVSRLSTKVLAGSSKADVNRVVRIHLEIATWNCDVGGVSVIALAQDE